MTGFRPGTAVRTGIVAVAAMMVLSVLLSVSPHAGAAGGAPAGELRALTGMRSSLGSGTPMMLPTPRTGSSAGRGTFFTTSDVGTVAASVQSCASGTCINATNDPVLNLTSKGVLAVAYTAYVDAAPCPAMRANATSEIGLRTSHNGGATWSAVQYLGNPDCTSGTGRNYADAWEPTITSLGNGTLVLAYIEFNVSSAVALPLVNFGPYSWDVNYDRLVVTESYDGGSTWALPTVINSSVNLGLGSSAFAPQRPWMTAVGQSLYLAWYNDTTDLGGAPASPFASAAVHLTASLDGGASWSAPVELPAMATSAGNYSINPYVLVTPSGELFVAYDSNLTYYATYACVSGSCYSNVWVVDILVAESTDNGTTFSVTDAVAGVPIAWASPSSGPFHDPAPQLAFSPSTQQLFLVYGAAVYHTWCSPTYGCLSYQDPEVLFVTNSSTLGLTWSTARVAGPTDLYETIFTSSMFMLPSIAVGPHGQLDLSMIYMNGTSCSQTYPFGCLQTEAYTWSTDNGSTFAPLTELNANSSVLGEYYGNGPLGEYGTLLANGTEVWIAWTNVNCPAALPVGSCAFPSAYGAAGVEVSELFTGPGVYLDFTEAGLATGTPWSVDVLGNVRAGAAPAVLNFTGIPVGDEIGWAPLANVSIGSTVQAHPTTSLAPPVTIVTGTTVTVTYSFRYLLNITTVPSFPATTSSASCYGGYNIFTWNSWTCPLLNYNMTPVPGQYWETPGTTVQINITPAPMYCASGATCYATGYENLSFLSWSGTGNGSLSSRSMDISVTMNGSVNETGSFQVNGFCQYTYATALTACVGTSDSMLFEESGLPNGTTWSVTVANHNQTSTNSSGTNQLLVSSPAVQGVISYTVWSVPAAGGAYWVPSSSPSSPVTLPTGGVVYVHFVRESITSRSFPVELISEGLPPGTAWTYTWDGAQVGLHGPSSTNLSVSSGTHTLGATTVTLSNESGYSVAAIDIEPLVENGTWQNSSAVPTSVTIDGPAQVFLIYNPVFWVGASASNGGSIQGGNAWVAPTKSTTLTATPAAGYSFVGWTGVGPGAVTSTHASIAVTPGGPVFEAATFQPLPAPTWVVAVSVSGLPAGTLFSISFGNTTYASTGPFDIHGLGSGSYSLSVPYVYLNSTNLSRFIVASVTSTIPRGGAGSYTLEANGSLNVTFDSESVLELTSTPGGFPAWSATGGATIGVPSGGTGSAWVETGATIALSEQPASGFRFDGWAGVGPGAVNTTAATPVLHLEGPIAETASFSVEPTPGPNTYTLTLEPSGLPASTTWEASVGSTGSSSVGGAISFAGLSGNYSVTIPAALGGAGVRFVNASARFGVSLSQNVTLVVAFTPEFLLTVSGSAGGTVGPVGGWFRNGSSIGLSAQPAPGYVLLDWTGTGNGSYSGNTTHPTITVSAPISEVARFVVPGSSTTSASSPTSGIVIALGALVGLLVIGLVVALLLGRRRTPPAAAPEPSPEEPSSETEPISEPSPPEAGT